MNSNSAISSFNFHGLQADGERIDFLPPSFVPGKWDVICQRGKECYDHVGNRRFRMAIDSHLNDYMCFKSRQAKSRIVSNIVSSIQASAEQSGGGFVRKDLLTRRWFKVSEKLAREKVGQALRDAIKIRRASLKKRSAHSEIAHSDRISSGKIEHNKVSERNISNLDTQSKNHFREQPKSSDGAKKGDRPQILGNEAISQINFGREMFENRLCMELEPTPIQYSREIQLPELFVNRESPNSSLNANTAEMLHQMYYERETVQESSVKDQHIVREPRHQRSLQNAKATQHTIHPNESAANYPGTAVSALNSSVSFLHEQQFIPTIIETTGFSTVRERGNPANKATSRSICQLSPDKDQASQNSEI